MAAVETNDRTARLASVSAELVVGRYRLEQLVARGGMGEVYAATDLSTGARVALKRMRAQDEGRRISAVHFMREYHALSQLKHPRIISVYDYGVDGDQPYYTMELLDGRDLSELSPVPVHDACRYLRDVASSLALLHARRLLHRDVSPRNVRRTSDGRCKLLDFGAMVPFGVPPNVIGTPPCVPPEVLQGGYLDQRADLYSLGALAYFVLTGRHAYPVAEIGALPSAWSKPIVRPSRLARDVPAVLDDLVMALLRLDAMQRPASAAEVIDRLSAAAGREPQSDQEETDLARSFLATSQLFGRGPQSYALQNHVKKCLSGHGSALLLRGEPGAGRSRMLVEAALLGQTHGLTVVRAVARARGSQGSLAADLVRGLLQAAPAEALRASTDRPQVVAHTYAVENAEARVQLLGELTSFVRDVASSRPLLIAIDDLDRADAFSGAFVAALAHQSADCALTLVATHDSRRERPVLANVSGLAETIDLQPLDLAQTVQLAVSLFGDVPNLERVAAWFHRVAAGNPKLTLQLAEHLFHQGKVRYLDGTWVLPTELGSELPPSAAEALLLRLEDVSDAARALAELLCVSRFGVSAERILDLSQRPAEVVFGSLAELVRANVLESAGEEYAFAQDALRESLLESLPPERRRELHRVWAERLLAGAPTPDDQLEAGWHLVHTDDELRGAELLAKIAPDWVERRINMELAVPSLERAYEIYERHGRPLAQRLHLRSLLVMSSYLFDHRLADRHAEPTLDALYPFTGLPLIERLAQRVDLRVAYVLGSCWTVLRWLFQPRATRGPYFYSALRYYARAAMGLVGLRALAVDVPGTRAALWRMRMFEGAPDPGLNLVYTLAKAVTLHNEGRGAEIAPWVRTLKQKLSTPHRAPRMNETERTDMLVGVLMLDGVNECYRQHSEALDHAERLEQIGTPLAIAAAMRIRMIYHMLRGELDQTQHFRRLVDLSAIQNGTVWQVDWFTVPTEGLAGAVWSDVVAMRRCLDALEKLAAEEPSFSAMRDAARVGYHFRRGAYELAARLGEEFISAHPPFTLMGWALTYTAVILCNLELGRAERALEICKLGLAPISDQHREYIYQYGTLDAVYATTLAALGDRERSEQIFRALVERFHNAKEHTRAALTHEYRVKAAQLLGDRAAMFAALQDMREAAVASGNPTVMLLADRVRERCLRVDSSVPPPSTDSMLPDDAANAATSISRPARSRGSR